ncbi:Similar to UBA3: NEDD8-activating enzyme E1 catalytic subunit (Pongo abelii) [Cotesia congregata]|uniref:NEDD8-activating enzyme E1 catalytic subunit n=1 Tax=Cotesia congregata TaxID=51543 RepID=A0A8J2HNI0_COTCN|nr:Similar to UBA3: NEDD8-activating enzyme E1 catalytic subunit (Pongo abelii) [Cotesia congregata]
MRARKPALTSLTRNCRPEFHHTHRRWSHLRKILERSGPFCRPDFEPSPDTLEFLMENCKVLVIGAGGLGCELLKNLALMGFRKIDVIDMDTIELSNLNRQFLFRHKDLGSSKAKVAAKFINERVPGCSVTPHCCKIQDKDESFYRQFHIVVCGLDSIVARRWINGMIISLLNYEDNELDHSSVIPLVDGGTEGFKGNARVILPGLSACIECTLDLYPPQRTYPLCTIANTPRLPEHCIEYVKVIQWPKENPYDCEIDGDDPQHINWIYEKSIERATQFSIRGVTYRLVQAEKRSDCLGCSEIPRDLEIRDGNIKLKDLIEILCERHDLQMKDPGITVNINGKNKTLYMHTVASIEVKTRVNLTKTLTELGLKNDMEINVADVTTPKTKIVKLKFQNGNDVEMA